MSGNLSLNGFDCSREDAVWPENSIYLKQQREIIPDVVDNETIRCQSAWTRMARKLDLSETAGDNPWRGR